MSAPGQRSARDEVAAFLASTRALTQELATAAGNEDFDALVAHVQRQQDSFEEVRELAERGSLDPAAVAELEAAAREILSSATARRDTVTKELDRIRLARTVARRSSTRTPSARFVSRRA